MSHFVDSNSKGFLASTALAMGTIVKLNAGGAVLATAAATDVSIGVTVEAATAGRTVNVKMRNGGGTSPVVLGGTVAVGDALTSNASGAAITTVTTGNQVVGYAIEAGTVGQVIEFWPATLKY